MAQEIGWHAAVNDTILLFYCKTAISKKQDIMQVFPGRRFSQEFWQLKFLYKSHQWLADFHHLYWIFWPKRRINCACKVFEMQNQRIQSIPLLQMLTPQVLFGGMMRSVVEG